MSKIGRLIIKLPAQTTLTQTDDVVEVKGPLGELSWHLPPGITLQMAEGTVAVINSQPRENALRPLHGLVRAKLANMVEGVSQGFKRILDINGVGFRAEVKGDEIWLHIGLSHPVRLAIIPGTTINVVKNEVTVSGIDKEKVGEMAAQLRANKKPEPYKGKGIKYREEIIRRKQGKAAKGSTS